MAAYVIVLAGPDTVIAASAVEVGAALVTTNPKHFPMAELVVLAADAEARLTPYSRP
jgi:predicted nucleic acid-binding protein